MGGGVGELVGGWGSGRGWESGRGWGRGRWEREL